MCAILAALASSFPALCLKTFTDDSVRQGRHDEVHIQELPYGTRESASSREPAGLVAGHTFAQDLKLVYRPGALRVREFFPPSFRPKRWRLWRAAKKGGVGELTGFHLFKIVVNLQRNVGCLRKPGAQRCNACRAKAAAAASLHACCCLV